LKAAIVRVEFIIRASFINFQKCSIVIEKLSSGYSSSGFGEYALYHYLKLVFYLRSKFYIFINAKSELGLFLSKSLMSKKSEYGLG